MSCEKHREQAEALASSTECPWCRLKTLRSYIARLETRWTILTDCVPRDVRSGRMPQAVLDMIKYIDDEFPADPPDVR
jgi:hypothetical protein